MLAEIFDIHIRGTALFFFFCVLLKVIKFLMSINLGIGATYRKYLNFYLQDTNSPERGRGPTYT